MGCQIHRGFNVFICQSSLPANDRNIILTNLRKTGNLLAYMTRLGNRHCQMDLEDAKNFLSSSLSLLLLHGSFIFSGVLSEQGIKPQLKAAPSAYPYI